VHDDHVAIAGVGQPGLPLSTPSTRRAVPTWPAPPGRRIAGLRPSWLPPAVGQTSATKR